MGTMLALVKQAMGFVTVGRSTEVERERVWVEATDGIAAARTTIERWRARGGSTDPQQSAALRGAVHCGTGGGLHVHGAVARAAGDARAVDR